MNRRTIISAPTGAPSACASEDVRAAVRAATQRRGESSEPLPLYLRHEALFSANAEREAKHRRRSAYAIALAIVAIWYLGAILDSAAWEVSR